MHDFTGHPYDDLQAEDEKWERSAYKAISDATLDHYIHIALHLNPAALREWVARADRTVDGIAAALEDHYDNAYLANAFRDIATRPLRHLSGKQRAVIARGMALMETRRLIDITRSVGQEDSDMPATDHERREFARKKVADDLMLTFDDKSSGFGSY